MAGLVNPAWSQGGALRAMPSDLAAKLAGVIAGPATAVNTMADLGRRGMHNDLLDEHGDAQPGVADEAFASALSAMGVGGAAAEAEGGMIAGSGMRRMSRRGAYTQEGESAATEVMPSDPRLQIGGNRPPPFPEYATKYPPTGAPNLVRQPGTWKDGPKGPTGFKAADKSKTEQVKVGASEADIPDRQTMAAEGHKYWLEKALTPEAKEFADARSSVMEDMQANGYKPYFDVSQRADVDPSHYPVQGQTVVDGMSKRPETIEKYRDAAFDPDSLARMQNAYDKGLETKETSGNWYFVKQLEDEFIKELGPEAGRAAFKEKFAKSMATTTGGANPTDNFLMAMYANHLEHQGADVPSNAWKMPYPIGGRFASGNMKMAGKMRGEELTTANPKRHNYQYDFLGHKVATLDEQISNLMKPGMNIPDNYAAREDSLNAMAEANGVDPRYFQEVGWAGAKDSPGKPMISHVNDSIERTSRLTGMSPSEVVRRGIVRSEIPMYSGGPGTTGMATVAGALAGQPPQQQQPVDPRTLYGDRGT